MKVAKDNLQSESLCQQLAQSAVEHYLRDNRVIEPNEPLPAYLKTRAGVFVSIKTKKGELRGCIGTIEPTCADVAHEIIRNAIKAATEDYRFRPLAISELSDLTYSVDLLSPLETITDLSDHDPKIWGLMIEAMGGRRGVLLPDLAGIETADEQLKALRHKVGLSEDVFIVMKRFRVQRYGNK